MLACLVVSALLAPASLPARKRLGAGSVTLGTAGVTGTWREGWFRHGAVHVSGTVSSPSQLKAFVRPRTNLLTVTASKSFSAAAGQPFAVTMTLPARPLPGTYVVSVAGESDGAKLPSVSREVTVPTPNEGVVSEAIVSATPDGPSQISLSGARVAYARFHFLAPPRARKVELVWRTPSYQLICQTKNGPLPGCKLVLPYTPTIHTYVRTVGAPLARGTWYCILMVGNTVAKRVAVRIR
jgi:hypothetical protein